MEIDHYYTQRDPFPTSTSSASTFPTTPRSSIVIPPLPVLSSLLLYDDLDLEEDVHATTADDSQPQTSNTNADAQDPARALAEAEAFLSTIEITRPCARKIAGSKRVAGFVKRGGNVNNHVHVIAGDGEGEGLNWVSEGITTSAFVTTDQAYDPTNTNTENRRMEVLQSITASRPQTSFEEMRVECYLQARVGAGFLFGDEDEDRAKDVGKGAGYRPPCAVPLFDERTGTPQRAWALPPAFRPVGVWVEGKGEGEGEGREGDFVMG